jgi:hypothetical protein
MARENLYCTPADVYALGSKRGSFANEGRLAQSVDASAGEIELGDHGFSTGDPCSFRAEGAGASLPSPLVTGVGYFVIRRTADRFAVSTTAGGAALVLGSTSYHVIVGSPLPIEDAIWKASRLLDDSLPSLLVPLVAPIPPTIVVTAAELAAASLGVFTNPEVKSFAVLLDMAQKRAAAWAKAKSVRPADGQTHTQLAIGSVAVGGGAVSPWRRYGGIR